MSDELLPYYNRELAFLRNLGVEFARKYPKIASRLRLSDEGSQDPHVERILEAFAYLNARVRFKLEDDFPEISDSLLGVLYPHYQRPTPSMAIAQLTLDPSQAELTAGYTFPRGTPVETEPVRGERCRYQMCYDTTLWPCRLETASLMGRPFAAPQTSRSSQAVSVLRLSLRSLQAAVQFSQFKTERLRFFLHAGQGQDVFRLYELLFNHTFEIALASSEKDAAPTMLPLSSLQPVGFEPDEAMLPYSARSFAGYRILSEYFGFPEKFLFFDIVGLNADRLARIGNQLDLYLYLNRQIPDLERTVSRDTIRLGCTPIVNLFKHRADPLVLTHTQTEYRIVPDSRRPTALEIYSIEGVTATSPTGEQVEYQPFYSFKHSARQRQQQTFWHAWRRPGIASAADENEDDIGTDMYLSLVDLSFSNRSSADWTLDIETTCVNRSLPRDLPFGGGHPELDLPEGRGPVSQIICLTAPTATIRPELKHKAIWKLISHLSLNHMSLADATEGADALREILKLYDVADSPGSRRMVEGVERIRTRRVVGRSGIPGAFVRGMEVQLLLNDENFLGNGAYLFATVLDRFLGLYVNINSFSKLVATTRQREQQEEPWKWPARAGEKILL